MSAVLIVQVSISKCPTDGLSCERYVRDGRNSSSAVQLLSVNFLKLFMFKEYEKLSLLRQ